jgi:predicted metal-dependent hydrolase
MGRADAEQASPRHRVQLDGREIEYRLLRSKVARKLRIRVGPDGVDVVQPVTRDGGDVTSFLAENGKWLLEQLDRTERLRSVRRAVKRTLGEIPYRGRPTRVRVRDTTSRATGNTVRLIDGEIVVSRGANSRTPVPRSLELWLRRDARRRIELELEVLTARLGRRPRRLYVMGQRTKWGNCSTRGNLSFNWRLILAPDDVLRYLVTHEAVHLAVPDHSANFWLTVRSLCPMAERARQWLCANAAKLRIELEESTTTATRC